MAGDSCAEEQLFALLSARFRVFAYQRVLDRDKAEDLSQEALAVVAAEYRKVEITLSFAAWAHKILDNRLLGYSQKQTREKGRFVERNLDQLQSTERVSDPTLRRRLLDCLKTVAAANRRYARIVNLHYQGFVREEICAMMGMTRDQSYVVMSRARSMLRSCLEKGSVRQ